MTQKPIYTVTYPHGGLVCKTDWPPMAEAAWSRASRDTFGGYARCTLSVDGRERAAGNSTQSGLRWPANFDAVGVPELYKATLLLARQLNIDAAELAVVATQKGLPLSRANIDDGRRGKGGCMAEVHVLLHCIVHVIKSAENIPDER